MNKSTKHPLVKSTFTALKWPFLAPVLPRLCLIGFNYAQPFLINRTVHFVGEPSSPQNKNIGYGLIGATAITYIGRAVRVEEHFFQGEPLICDRLPLEGIRMRRTAALL